MSIKKLLNRLARDERGLAAVEYGLICCLIVVAMVAALNTMANAVNMTWSTVNTQTSNAVQQATGG